MNSKKEQAFPIDFFADLAVNASNTLRKNEIVCYLKEG
jgi:hypothetical protein